MNNAEIELNNIKQNLIGHVLLVYGDLENINSLITHYMTILTKISNSEKLTKN